MTVTGVEGRTDSPATLHAFPLKLLRSLKLEIIFTSR